MLEFETDLSIMVLFITITICDFRNVFFKVLRPYFIKGYISKNTRIALFIFILLLSKPLFGLFSNFFEGFCVIGKFTSLRF